MDGIKKWVANLASDGSIQHKVFDLVVLLLTFNALRFPNVFFSCFKMQCELCDNLLVASLQYPET